LKALSSVLKNNSNVEDFIIARDSKPMDDSEYFQNFNPRLLSQKNCMKDFYKKGIDGARLEGRTIDDSLRIVNCYVSRLEELANLSRNENILCLEPDSFVRGKVHFRSGVDMECLAVNAYPENLIGKVEKISGKRLPLRGWGFCIGLTNRTTLVNIAEWLRMNQECVRMLLTEDQRLENIDYGLPLLAHLSGGIVSKTSQITEVNRNRMWRFNRKPLVHQYKKYY
jgi:hypothetical protein